MITALITALLPTISVSVTNPVDSQRANVPVVVAVPAEASRSLKGVTVKDHPEIPCQIDDMDGDGRPDEIVFLVDLAPRQSSVYTLQLSETPVVSTVEPGTSAYIKLNDKNKKYPRILSVTFPGDADNRTMYNSVYGHGAVLEGLYNAIRVYMDNRQSIDLYAKNTPRLELETTGFYTTADQLEKGFGRDILWAGTSVALGSFRGWNGSEPLTIDSVASRSQRVVTTGPLRSVIEVSDRAWRHGGKDIDMTQTYTIYKGHRDIDVEIKLDGAEKGEVFATGVQKVMNDNTGFILPEGLAGSWGNNVPDKSMASVVDTLGLGISVSSPYLVKTLEDDVNYLTLVTPDENGVIRYTIVSAATRDEASPKSYDEWKAWLEKWRKELENPVKVTVK
ncbi:MAG: DUF4861 domain-containing protein [Bacteroides sp.]|nr:DUF4861 domain-containing protein [Bacteroides sp.]